MKNKEMREIHSEIFGEKRGIKQNKREEGMKAGKQRIISSQGHRTGRSTSLSHFSQLTSFFLVVLVRLFYTL